MPAQPAPGHRTETSARLSLVLGRLIRMLRREAPSPIGPGSLGALFTLARCGPLRLGDLAHREGVAPPTLTRMVAAMEDAGYVVRRPDPDDRRAVQVSITPAGNALVEDMQAARTQVLRGRLVVLSPEQWQALEAALPALERLAEDES